MPSYSAHVEVSVAPEAVWPLVADLARHPEWASDELGVESVDGTSVVGSRFRSTATAKGRTFSADIVVTEIVEPSRFSFRAADATGEYEHVFTLSRTASGTRIERTISGSLDAKQALLFWLVLLPVKRPSARRTLHRLKELVEA